MVYRGRNANMPEILITIGEHRTTIAIMELNEPTQFWVEDEQKLISKLYNMTHFYCRVRIEVRFTSYTMSCRREKRRNTFYWYAYRRDAQGKLHNAYLGKTETMTSERLRTVAEKLWGVV